MMLLWIPLLICGQTPVEINFSNREALTLEITVKDLYIGLVNPATGPIEIPGAIEGKIYANTNWVLISSTQEDFISLEGNTIPINRLKWRVGGKDYSPFKMGDVHLLEGNPTSEDGMYFSVDLMLDLKWKDEAGEYSTKLMFTVMKQ